MICLLRYNARDTVGAQSTHSSNLYCVSPMHQATHSVLVNMNKTPRPYYLQEQGMMTPVPDCYYIFS